MPSLCHFSVPIKSSKSKDKKSRGIRKSKFIPGDWSHNLHIASHSHIPGDEPISGQADAFFGDCTTYANLVLLEFTKSEKLVAGKYRGSIHRVESKGYNASLMKFYRMTKKRVDEFPHGIAYDICEQIMRAIKTGDCFFFTDLARLCKYKKSNPDVSLEYWLTLIHWHPSRKPSSSGGQNYFFTIHELCDLAFRRGFSNYDNLAGRQWKIPVRRMRKICSKLGIEHLNARKSERDDSDYKIVLAKLLKAKS